MNTNLDKIALDLYGKIQTRYPNVKIGDENAKVFISYNALQGIITEVVNPVMLRI
jgi:hypothetical protein